MIGKGVSEEEETLREKSRRVEKTQALPSINTDQKNARKSSKK